MRKMGGCSAEIMKTASEKAGDKKPAPASLLSYCEMLISAMGQDAIYSKCIGLWDWDIQCPNINFPRSLIQWGAGRFNKGFLYFPLLMLPSEYEYNPESTISGCWLADQYLWQRLGPFLPVHLWSPLSPEHSLRSQLRLVSSPPQCKGC